MRAMSSTRVGPCFTRAEIEALRNAIGRAVREARASVANPKRAHELMEESLLLTSIRRELNLFQQQPPSSGVFDLDY